MIAAGKPDNEAARQEALLEYQLLDTLPEKEYDAITKLATQVCGAKMSTITLVDNDRQWFKSTYNLAASETIRTEGFCAHCILDPHHPTIVENTLKDERFQGNPFTTGEFANFHFYAGVPLLSTEGLPVGTLCVLDDRPRSLSPEQQESLEALANQVVQLMELRKKVFQYQESEEQLKRINQNLEDFSYIVSHDIKSPLNSITQMVEAFVEDTECTWSTESQSCLDLIRDSATGLEQMIDNILKYSKAVNYLESDRKLIDLNTFLPGIVRSINTSPQVQIVISPDLPSVFSSPTALRQIFANLVSNSIKYNDKSEGRIALSCRQMGSEEYKFEVSDNGMGIPKDKLESIFDLFYRVNQSSSCMKHSSGVGLAIVKKLINDLGGRIEVESAVNEGTTFKFYLPSR
ncbi:hypothetical protein GGR26_003615 [Lewinella marina]|uniref:histidine kinase n=1 Tax=Neolewinella marina TaxID=438751 RepID=A0A2G0CBF9_9BACT|nr:GAF domain-containing sensor histidine kinase [Neolewinella marina]NJB87829.1 hypothetical protein [Neolewinella marina]PHK97292.1 hypothetical protein CGL56_17090 [Neolewinella marina]